MEVCVPQVWLSSSHQTLRGSSPAPELTYPQSHFTLSDDSGMVMMMILVVLVLEIERGAVTPQPLFNFLFQDRISLSCSVAQPGLELAVLLLQPP